MIPKSLLANKMVKSGIVVVLRQIDPDHLEPITEQLIRAGLTTLEVTVDHPDAYSSIRRISDRFAGRALVGAGTVLDQEAAYLAIQHGAEFIVSPTLHKEIIRTTLRYGKLAVPGAMTPSEMVKAVEWGADLVKVFPVASLGTQFFNEIKGPIPHIPIIASGGIGLENIPDLIKAGVWGVCVGSDVIDPESLQEREYTNIYQRALQYVKVVEAARRSSHFPAISI